MAAILQPETSPGAPRRWTDAGIAVAIAIAATLLPYHRGLSFPFALDDYTFLYPVSGLEPAAFSLRRWLAVHGYYWFFLHVFGPRPLAWHVCSYLLHVCNAGLVYVLARKFGAERPAAWIACGLFAASPLAFTVLYWAAGIQEIGSSFFLLAATLVAMRTDRHRWAAVPLFALAMLCKESVLAAPLALVLVLGRRTRGLAGAMLATGLVVFLASGLHNRMLESNLESPYSTAYDLTLLVNLATQLVWFLAPWRPYPDRLAAPHPNLALPAAAVVGAALIAFVVGRGRHARPVGLAIVWFVALLLPVLPLRQHSYAYYSYLSQAGFLILAGVALEALARRLRPRSWDALFVAGVAVVSASILFSARNARTHETLTLQDSQVPYDAVVRYGRAAGALVAAIREARLSADVRRVGFMNAPSQLGKTAQTPGEKRPGMQRVRRWPLRESFRSGRLVDLYFPELRGAWIDSLTAADEGRETVLFFTSGFDDVVRLEDAARAYCLEAQGRLLVGDRIGARRNLERVLQIEARHPPASLLLAAMELEDRNPARAAALVRDLRAEDLPPDMRGYLDALRAALGHDGAVSPSPSR